MAILAVVEGAAVQLTVTCRYRTPTVPFDFVGALRDEEALRFRLNANV